MLMCEERTDKKSNALKWVNYLKRQKKLRTSIKLLLHINVSIGALIQVNRNLIKQKVENQVVSLSQSCIYGSIGNTKKISHSISNRETKIARGFYACIIFETIGPIFTEVSLNQSQLDFIYSVKKATISEETPLQTTYW